MQRIIIFPPVSLIVAQPPVDLMVSVSSRLCRSGETVRSVGNQEQVHHAIGSLRRYISHSIP